MSVINNVLKDLESRESQFTPIEIDAIGLRPAPARDLKPFILGGLLLVLLLVTAWIYLQDRFTGSQDTLSTPMTATTPSVAEQPVAQPEINEVMVTDQMIGNQIIGLQIRESEDDMSMEFALRDRVVAFLKERGENNFSYHLRDIESQILAPVMSDNRWIRKLAINSSDSGVDVSFQTAEDILVETRQKLVNEEPSWVIVLRKSAAPVVVETAQHNVSVDGTATSDAKQVSKILEPEANEAAGVEFEAGLRQSPADEGPGVVSLDIKSTNPNTKSINQLGYALELINTRRFSKAQAILQELLGGSEDYAARQHLLALYNSQNRSDRFLRLVRDSMAKYPDDILFKTEYARSLYQSAAYQAVIELFAAEGPIDANQQALVAASYQRLDEHESAVRHYQNALEQNATNARNWIGLGISQEHIGALADALNSYQQAANLGNLNLRLQTFVENKRRTLAQVLN